MTTPIEHLKTLVPKGTFFRRVIVLAGGTALGQGIVILTLPLLTRLYSPDALGRFGLFTAVINIAFVGASCRYEAAIVAAKNDEEAAHLTMLSIIVAIFTTLLATLGFYVLIKFHFFGFDHIPISTVFWIPLVFLLTAAFQVLRYWFIRENLFTLISKVIVIQNLIRALSQVIFGLTSLGWLGLVIGDCLGRGAGIREMFNQSWQSLIKLISPISLKKLLRVAHQYLDFPIYSLPSSLINILAVSLVMPIITQLYGTTAAGYFLLAQRTLTLPMGLISNSVGDAFYNQVASYACHQPLKVNSFFWYTAKNLALVGLIPSLVLAFLSPHIFSLVFGAPWKEAGLLVALIAPWSLAALIVSPISCIIFIVGGQRYKFIYDVFLIAILLIVFYCASNLGFSLTTAVALLSGLNIIAYGLYFVILSRITYKFSQNIF